MIGNKAIAQRLRASLESGRLHAVLLVGPTHVGKTTLALEIARERLGRVPLVADPDLILVETDGRTISLALIQEALHKTRQAALTNRTVIIAGAERLTPEAANGLLVFLENPPRRTLVLLTAPQTISVLPTIRSRCAPFVLGPVPESAIRDGVAQLTTSIDPQLLAQAVNASRGLPGLALRFVQDAEWRAQATHVRELLQTWQKNDVMSRLRLAATIAEDPPLAAAFLELAGAAGSAQMRPYVLQAQRRLARNVQTRAVLEAFAMLPV